MREAPRYPLLGLKGWPAFGGVGVLLLLGIPLANLFGGQTLVPDYLIPLLGKYACYAILALSLDLVWGYAGIMSFGQALFFGSAGYGVALLARDLNITSILLVLPAGTLIGLTTSLLLGGFYLSTEGAGTRVRFALEAPSKGFWSFVGPAYRGRLRAAVGQLERLPGVIEGRTTAD